MSNVNRGVLVSELHWIKFIDTGKWNFYHYCDGVDRVWDHDEDGFVAVAFLSSDISLELKDLENTGV